MKFNHLEAFEKHLKTADPAHLSSIYLIADSDEYIQKKLAKKLKQENESWYFWKGDELSLREFKEATLGVSMFSDRSTYCIIGVDKLIKGVQQALLEHLKAPIRSQRFILTASSLPKELAALVAKEGVIVDLTGEKPWDRDRRLAGEIVQKFAREKIRASLVIAEQMVKTLGSDSALIDQEVEKLICFLQGKLELTRQDLDIIGNHTQNTIFKVGQYLLDKQLKEALTVVHEQQFPLVMIIYSLRSMIQRCFRIKALPQNLYEETFPQLRGSLLEKNVQLSMKYSEQQFKRMLQILFETELLMKSQGISEEFLISQLLMKLGAPHEPLSV